MVDSKLARILKRKRLERRQKRKEQAEAKRIRPGHTTVRARTPAQPTRVPWTRLLLTTRAPWVAHGPGTRRLVRRRA